MKIFWAFVSICSFVICSCAQQEAPEVQQVDIEKEKASVERVIGQFLESWKTGDVELFSRIMAHDPGMLNFGTDAAELWVGWEPLLESIRKQMETFKDVVVSVSKQAISVHESGSVAWFATVLDWKMVASGKPVEIQGSRFSGVLEKRNGNWMR